VPVPHRRRLSLFTLASRDPRLLIGAVWLGVAEMGCQDYGINKSADDPDAAPDLRVDPNIVDFGGVSWDGSVTTVLSLRNEGTATLIIDTMSPSAPFSLLPVELPLSIGVGAGVEVELVYEPVTDEDDGFLTIESNDRVAPVLDVPLRGGGLYPDLVIDPEAADLGPVYRCHETLLPVTLRNVGDVALVVSAISQTGEGWSLDSGPVLPTSIAAGGSLEVVVAYQPTGDREQPGTLFVESNDRYGTESADWTAFGDGFASDERSETWRQPEGPFTVVDLLFFVDQSSSMDDDRERLRDNFGGLVERLDASGVSWQAMVATDDDGCSNSGILRAGDPDAVAAFQEAVVGPWGWYTEAGLEVARAGLAESAGGCNDGFLRPESKPLLVMVSDEADQSPAGWGFTVGEIEALAPGAMVVSIVGDVPDGCSTATPGTGYYDASMSTGGSVHSICSLDWTDTFEDIASLLVGGGSDTFPLADPPDPDTIIVQVDDLRTSAWTYDAAANAVIMDEQPAAGAWIEIEYSLSAECP
jgi:hypothetical protein